MKLPLYRTDPAHTTRYLFFTGKGGVGKTSLSCATALKLAEAGKRVLLVSTDPASNLDEVLETKLTNKPTPVAGVPKLDAMNINPVEAAPAYRERLIGPMRGLLPEAALRSTAGIILLPTRCGLKSRVALIQIALMKPTSSKAASLSNDTGAWTEMPRDSTTSNPTVNEAAIGWHDSIRSPGFSSLMKNESSGESPMRRRAFLLLLSLSTLAGATGCGRKTADSGPTESTPKSPSGAGFAPDVELVLTAAPDELPLLPGDLTRVWRFKGSLLKGPTDTLQIIPNSYLGPVIRLRRGQKVRIRFVNQLPEDSVIHWHGLDVPESADGHPRLAIGQGQEYVVDFEVINRAGTYWYHPHPHGRTGAQVYQGLAGLLLVRDAEEDALALPSGGAELPCVLQDRRFDERNQLVYAGGGMMGMMGMMNGFLGNRVLVNGQPPSTTEVDAAWHRIRLLNGSNARIYKLAWSHGAQMTVIGGDGGLLEHPVYQQELTLAPGQRADLLLDLTALAPGTEVHLKSQAFAEGDAGGGGMMGMRGGPMMSGMGGGSNVPNGAPLRVMTLRTRARKGPAFRVPERLSSFDKTWSLRDDATIRRVSLSFQQMGWLIGGRTFEMEGVAPEESVGAGSTQLWEFVNIANPMGMQAAHPIHIHGRQFRVISRSGGSVTNALSAGMADAGWRDTVLVLPGETVRVQVTFTRYPGLYLYHCHILEHEDMGMMRNFRVTQPK